MSGQGETLRQRASRLMNEYEALGPRPGGETAYTGAMLAYRRLLAEHPEDAQLHLEYGYLQECHGRNSIRAAVGCYEQAIELDPGWDKPHYQLIFARSALHEKRPRHRPVQEAAGRRPGPDPRIPVPRGAYLSNGALDEAGKVIAAGRALEPDDDMLLAAEAQLLDASGRRKRRWRRGGRSSSATPTTSAPTS